MFLNGVGDASGAAVAILRLYAVDKSHDLLTVKVTVNASCRVSVRVMVTIRHIPTL